MTYTPLPIGIDDFGEMITKEYYYVDKTWFIKELLDKKGKANLFTRPRRFGKTLNMSMLKYFFEMPQDRTSSKALFDGLRIMDAGEKYTKEQEQYPVISLTLKSAKQPTWELALAMLKRAIAEEYYRHKMILSNDAMSDRSERYKSIMKETGNPEEYVDSLKFLSECLYGVYQKKVIILIDEYDVPLENAYYSGFYHEMTAFIRSLFESALKTNPYLDFSVITGCLRISKESIFTGLNNLEIISILNKDYGEHFGFTEREVQQMLTFYQREKQMDTMRQWYDGYRFGNSEVYNPWSVINFTKALATNEDAFPIATWSNTSSNSIVRDLIYQASDEVKGEIEQLMLGGSIEKKVHEDITYEDIYTTEENLWNFLFFTGYLRMDAIRMENVNRYITMSIPNNELLYIYENTVENWFRENVKKENLTALYQAMLEGDAVGFQEGLEEELYKTISYMDSKEAFYHGFLLGVFAQIKGYRVKSNREAGLGRYDICVYSLNVRKPVVLLELKLADSYRQLGEACDRALGQIREKQYDEELIRDGYTEAICYGVGFYKKQVQIKVERTPIGMF
ncbi:MAG: AAA family ATPase [Lachnospiraceae bacterium]|nr:AAA family ATPase [Lachnospiraceae bacterium]